MQLRTTKGLMMLTIILMVGLTLSGCSSLQSAIVGKWRAVASPEQWEFFKDGTVYVTGGGCFRPLARTSLLIQTG